MESDPKSDSSPNWERIDRLLQSALELEPDRRTSFLREACAGDPALLAEVESLLKSHEDAGSFMENAALGGAPKQVASSPAGSRVGQKMGPYEILSLLGSGGMGEVYRAIDTRLNRTVAIKFLPAHLSRNPQLRQRLEREARAVSSLNHPHICTLYDVGRDGDSEFLVMEFLEGQSLADRLKKGTLPVEQALHYGIELADALSAAHRQGVIHRDVKPGNIMLVKNGVKLLDFGLAKVSFDPARKSDDPPTAAGTILGTLQYMAPEQLEGAEGSVRTDIFAFGAVLYEMVTGQPAFRGKSQASLIASIMTSAPPPVSTVRPVVPDTLDHVIQRCLAKDPEERWQSAYDLKRELQWIAGTVSNSTSVMPSPPRSVLLTLRRPLAWGLIAVGAAVGLSLASLFFNANVDEAPTPLPIPFPLVLPSGVEIADNRFGAPAISPDGSRVVFSAVSGGKSQLYVKAINSLELPQPLEDTENAFHPFWSADGHSIGFFSRGRLRTVPSSGGKVTDLCPAGVQGGGTWNGAGDIVYGGGEGAVLSIVSKGGTCKPLTTKRDGEIEHSWPYFLPDGRHFVYSIGAGRDDSGAKRAVYIGSLDAPEKRIEVYPEEPGSNVIYAQDHLLFVRENELWAQRYDVKNFKLEGVPTRLPVGEVRSRTTGRGYVSVSTNGPMTYRPWNAVVYQVMQFDRKGNSKRIGEIPHDFLAVHLSPDEKKIAYFTWRGLGENSGRIELLDVSSGARSIFNPDQKTRAGRAPLVWSPVENLLYFATIRCRVGGECPQSIYKGTPSHSDRLFKHPQFHLSPLDISRDGRYLLVHAISHEKGEGDTEGRMVLWYAELGPEPKLHEVESKTYAESRGRFSPNGRLLAYTSRESGQFEVYIRSFPSAEGRTPVSRGRGYNPHWRMSDGREIVYVNNEGILMSVSVDVGPGSAVTLGPPEKILQLPVKPPPTREPAEANWWTMSADGKLFYVAVPMEQKDQITVLVNWTALLKQ